MAEDRQVITPMLVYDDAPAAIEFLCRAFGFDEQSRFDMPDGTIGHADASRCREGISPRSSGRR